MKKTINLLLCLALAIGIFSGLTNKASAADPLYIWLEDRVFDVNSVSSGNGYTWVHDEQNKTLTFTSPFNIGAPGAPASYLGLSERIKIEDEFDGYTIIFDEPINIHLAKQYAFSFDANVDVIFNEDVNISSQFGCIHTGASDGTSMTFNKDATLTLPSTERIYVGSLMLMSKNYDNLTFKGETNVTSVDKGLLISSNSIVTFDGPTKVVANQQAILNGKSNGTFVLNINNDVEVGNPVPREAVSAPFGHVIFNGSSNGTFSTATSGTALEARDVTINNGYYNFSGRHGIQLANSMTVNNADVFVKAFDFGDKFSAIYSFVYDISLNLIDSRMILEGGDYGINAKSLKLKLTNDSTLDVHNNSKAINLVDKNIDTTGSTLPLYVSASTANDKNTLVAIGEVTNLNQEDSKYVLFNTEKPADLPKEDDNENTVVYPRV